MKRKSELPVEGLSCAAPRLPALARVDEQQEVVEPQCSVCNAAPRKYCCPRCGIVTCSLSCVQQHKSDTGCSGRRDRTAYTPMSAYNDVTLRSDFHFLEDAALGVDRAKRARQRDVADGRRWTTQPAGVARRMNPPANRRQQKQQQQQQQHDVAAVGQTDAATTIGARARVEPMELSDSTKSGSGGGGGSNNDGDGDDEDGGPEAKASPALLSTLPSSSPPGVAAALASGGLEFVGLAQQHTSSDKKLVRAAAGHHVTLLLMPPGMSRHERNTSRLEAKTQTIHWRIEWEFPLASTDAGGASKEMLVTEKANHDTTWYAVLSKHLMSVDPCGAATRHTLRRYCTALRQADQSNIPAGSNGFRILLRKEPHPANDPRYYELDPFTSVRDSLLHKTIIEYPAVVVALDEDAKEYALVGPLVEVVEEMDGAE